MPYNAAAAAANKAANAVNGFQDLVQAMVEAFREASQPAPPDKVEIVTVGVNSDSKLDQLIFCPDCLGKDGRGWAWGTHMIYWPVPDPNHPGEMMRKEIPHAHPRAPKTISYDAITARKGLEDDKYGKQCLSCGQKMGVAA